jgi:hypothetical protein
VTAVPSTLHPYPINSTRNHKNPSFRKPGKWETAFVAYLPRMPCTMTRRWSGAWDLTAPLQTSTQPRRTPTPRHAPPPLPCRPWAPPSRWASACYCCGWGRCRGGRRAVSGGVSGAWPGQGGPRPTESGRGRAGVADARGAGRAGSRGTGWGERGAGRGELGRLNRNEKTGKFWWDRENRMLMLLGPMFLD